MNQLLSTVKEFIQDLQAQKLRTFLTIFGIMWGTVAIVVLLAFGMGFKKQLSINMHGIGESIVIMFPGKTTKTFEGFGKGRRIRFLENDAALLKREVRGIKAISPEYNRRSTPVRLGKNILSPNITGIHPIYGDIRNIICEAGGRFFNDLDIQSRRRVTVIGDKVKEYLFGDEAAIGELIYLGDMPFRVIGVMQKKTQNSSYNSRDQDRVFIPASTFASVFGDIYITNIIYQHADPTQAEATNEKVRAVLGKRYKFDPTDEDAVWLWDTSEFDKFVFYFFLAFNIFMGVIGSFTLAVGGIGVANIMYVVVQERFKEIGIKRAVGATRANILFQFFMETFFIIALGAMVGFLIAFGITQAMQLIPIKEFVGTPEISIGVTLATVAVLLLIGLAAGLMPARKAANLDVVECIRT